MATTALATLDQRLSEAIGDYISETVTTPLATDNYIIATGLNKYTNVADYFNDWWAYISSGSTINEGQDRRVSDFKTSSWTLDVLGNAWTCDSSGSATFNLYRYSRTNKVWAINRAIEEVYPELYRPVENRELITGNILPPFIWTSSTALRLYSSTDLTSYTKTTTAKYKWGGAETSALALASAADGYIYLSSDDYPRLLDLKGTTVDLECWAYPVDTANDPWIQITTAEADGTTQTLPADWTAAVAAGQTAPKTYLSLLKLENQTLNDDLVQVIIRLRVHTNAKSVYFSPPRLNGRNIYEYMLPDDFKDEGHVSQVYVQSQGKSDPPCDDIYPRAWERVYGARIIKDGTYEYIRLPNLYANERQIKLIGRTRLEALSSASDTITLDGEKVNLLVAYAAYKLYQREAGTASGEDRINLLAESEAWKYRYDRLLPRLRMAKPAGTMNLRNAY